MRLYCSSTAARVICVIVIAALVIWWYLNANLVNAGGEVIGNYSGPSQVITAPTLHVISLNIAHGRKDKLNQALLSGTVIRRNIHEIGTIFKANGASIVALQEADRPSVWSGRFDHVKVLAEIGSYPFYVNASHANSIFFSFGTALLSTVPLNNVHSKTFKPSPPTLNKGFVRATVQWNPKNKLAKPLDVDIVSIHLDFSRRSVRQKQASELISAISNHSRHLIILGDLNEAWDNENSVVREIASRLNMKVFRPDAGDLGTFRRNGRRLDWILISQALRYEAYSAMPEVVSDHLAVSAQIALK